MLDRKTVVVGMALVAAVSTGALLGWQKGAPNPSPVAGTTVPEETATATAPGLVTVQITGHVLAPGVFRVPAGSLVADVIVLAGGATPTARLDGLNLASPVVDGDQIVVPGPGDVIGGQSDESDGGPLSLNAAEAADLEALPGIGPVLAQRIIDYREENGPFETVEDLLDVSGIGEAVLGGLRDLVVP